MKMELSKDSKLLRIFIGELDKAGHTPLYEAIVYAAKKNGIAGATVLRGIMGFGANSRVQTAKILHLSQDLPIVVEIVDHLDKINAFIPKLNELFAQADCGGLVTIEKAEVWFYKPSKKKR